MGNPSARRTEVWQRYIKEYEEIEPEAQKVRDRAQLRALMASHNGGADPTAEDLEHIFAHADKDRSGKLDAKELCGGIARWCALLKERAFISKAFTR